MKSVCEHVYLPNDNQDHAKVNRNNASQPKYNTLVKILFIYIELLQIMIRLYTIYLYFNHAHAIVDVFYCMKSIHNLTND